jgi:Icc-related predicted phosphoesterase/ribosomal protein S14
MSNLIRIIAISDLHQGNPISIPLGVRVVSQEKLIQNLIQRNADAILVAGDLQDYMWNNGLKRSSLSHIKNELKNDNVYNALNRSKTPIYYIWGNTDVMDFEKDEAYDETPTTDELREWFREEFSNLNYCHNTVQYLENLPIIGYDDANKTTEEHSGKSWKEPKIHNDLLAKFKNNLASEEFKRTILLTHTPPRGILDFSSLGDKHIGSYYLRELIEDFQPLISVFGHVHYCGGYSEFVGRTQCINVSSFGLAVSHEILFGQSAFELQIDLEDFKVISTTMIVPHYWIGRKKKAFVEYRICQACGRHTPFARRQFKICRVCLAARRIENRLKNKI